VKIDYFETEEFAKDFKKLAKRFKTLADDIETAQKNAIELYYLHKIDNQSIFQIHEFKSDEMEICKLKKFACKALKGKGVQSGIRVIYAYHKNRLRIEFIEMYYKGDKKNENRERIKAYLSKQTY
jgi:mRNA-degrading endonuclease RelE of RelBE toxin-antitoxin system